MLPKTIDEVIEQLDYIIIKSSNDDSRLGYFPALYKRVTIKVKEKIAANYFDDNDRMEKLDVIFANRYIEAYNNFHNEESCSKSWLLSFKTSDSWSPLVIQHLLLGMNAHISLDLGIAAAEVSGEGDIEQLRSDFLKINEILSSLVDEIQDQLAKMWPLLKPIDWFAGRLDESIAAFGMGIARDAAWQVALEYSEINSKEEKETYIFERDLKVETFGSKLANPGFMLNIVIRLLRYLEIGSVKRKIKILS